MHTQVDPTNLDRERERESKKVFSLNEDNHKCVCVCATECTVASSSKYARAEKASRLMHVARPNSAVCLLLLSGTA